jgi:uncharacterized protein involved in outer membrane biogenesis
MASAWYRSKVFLIVAVLVVLVVAVLLVVPYFLNVERYRPLVVEQLKQVTGRDFEIGSLALSFLPSVRVVVSDLRIKNPPGFPAGDTVAVGSVNIGLALMPLLRRQVEVTSVTVNAVQASLLSDERGQTNYASLLKKPHQSSGKEAAAAPVSLGRISGVALRDVNVSTGSFWRREKRVYPGWAVTGINIDAGGLDLSDPAWLSKMTAELDLGTVEVNGPGWKQPLRFDDGDITVKDKAASGDYSLALGALRARGTVKVANLEHPVADFTLAMKELNVADLGAVLGGAAKGGPSAPAGRDLLARGGFKVDRLVAPPLTAQNVEGKVRLYENRIEVDPFSLNFYSGRTQGSLGADLSGESMLTRVNARVEGVNVTQVLSAVSPGTQQKLSGTFEADARLGVPLGAANPLAAASGEGTFAVRNGTFPGLDVQGTLAQMAKLLAFDVPTGDTRFSYFGGDFRISGARVHSEQLVLNAEALEASLRGSFGFDQSLNYNGTGLLKGQGTVQEQQQSDSNPLGGLRRVFGKVVQQTMNISGMRIPFTVRGTMKDPKILPGGVPQPIPQR